MTLNYLSYGGGVQSTALLLMMIEGLIEKADIVYFADTGSETPSTYSTIEKMKKRCEDASIEFQIVYGSPEQFEEGVSLHEYYMKKEKAPHLPMIKNPQCTWKFKIAPIRRAVRKKIKELGLDKTPKPWAKCMLGITTDEKRRARKSDIKYVAHQFPLIEMDLSRRQCEEYLQKFNDLNVSKSGCFCCPYMSVKGFNKLRIEEPDLFQICIDMEKSAHSKGTKNGLIGGKSVQLVNHTHTLEDFGIQLYPEDIQCDSVEGGCFL